MPAQNPAILEIHRLVNKISSYTEMIYSDALLLTFMSFLNTGKMHLAKFLK